ncbi:hypothetical protein MK396_08800 [Streptococcus oralis]|jgi:domain of unknown function (DUF1705)|uniref:hypothetical protein n=1 Tax=Streptococcus oralis TaxID=1303 RepID=UPI0022833F23|nr:hypothetical protein [Streptococcus oralis]MCY7085428.1 hypothetical protein [Streptococcus oralis]
MHDNQTQVLTYPTNLTLLPKTKCQDILNSSLRSTVGKEVRFLGNSCFSINNVESYELKMFKGTYIQKLEISNQISESQQNDLKNLLNWQLTLNQLRLGIIPLLTIKKLSIQNEKIKKSCVHLTLWIELGYRSEWLA